MRQTRQPQEERSLQKIAGSIAVSSIFLPLGARTLLTEKPGKYLNGILRKSCIFMTNRFFYQTRELGGAGKLKNQRRKENRQVTGG
jgi:hypothetical protein